VSAQLLPTVEVATGAPTPFVVGIDPSFTALGISDGLEHAIISAPKGVDTTDRAGNTRMRAHELSRDVAAWVKARYFAACARADAGLAVDVYIEAPMLSSLGGGASHLYELGWLMNDLYRAIEAEIPQQVIVREVASATVRKFATGKGNTPKTQMSLAVFKRFGVEFDRDPGCDKLFAFCLQRYGEAVARGDVVFIGSARRGAGAKETKRLRSVAARRA
jgi:Holliday junction resolvasome RuvABC endonuclease subunit